MPSLNQFGPLVTPEDVTQATVSTLRLWMPEYLAEQERKAGIQHRRIPRPPTPESYHGGLDFDSWIGSESPEVMVVVKPTGSPEIDPATGYTQGYSIEVGCLCIGPGGLFAERQEDDARIIASYLGAASMLLVHQSTLGGLAERLWMTSAPDPSLYDPDRRAIAQVVTGFEAWVVGIVLENGGPRGPTPKESPGYGGPEEPFKDNPEAKTETVTVKGEPVTTPL